jgi:two-component system OmpR family response regulator
MGTKVLLVEDDRAYSEELGAYLARYGFDVGRLETADDLVDKLHEASPDVVVLDQFMQGADVLAELHALRRSFSGQIMVLTGNDCERERILGLENGADEFLVKGVSFREVVARLRVLARHGQHPVGSPTDNEAPHGDRDAGWSVDPVRRQIVSPAEGTVELTGLEFETFFRLYSKRGSIVSKEELALHVLKRPLIAAGRSLENLLSRIRVKFMPHVKRETLIKAIRGKGYVFLGFQ